MSSGLLGLIDTPMQKKPTAVGKAHAVGATWCADNSAFGKNYPGDEAWFAWLTERAAYAETCAFAVAPDVVGDAAATLERSAPWLPKIRALGYPVALVGQDGMTPEQVPWDDIDAFFIGGSTAWKLGPHARTLAAEAKARGKWLHMGRVNSQRRYEYARRIGCDSVDGTFLTFGPDVNLPKLLSWVRSADQMLMEVTA